MQSATLDEQLIDGTVSRDSRDRLHLCSVLREGWRIERCAPSTHEGCVSKGSCENRMNLTIDRADHERGIVYRYGGAACKGIGHKL